MAWTELAGELMHAAVLLGWTVFALLFLGRRLSSAAGRRVVSRATRARFGIALQAVGFAIVWGVRRREVTPIWQGLPALDVLVALVVVGLMVGSLTVILLAVRQLGQQWAFQARTIEHHELVTTGPYGRVRHPIYAGFAGFFLATGLTMTAWWPLLVACLAFGAGTKIRVQAEDALLAATFGSVFEKYRQGVPALIPRRAHVLASR